MGERKAQQKSSARAMVKASYSPLKSEIATPQEAMCVVTKAGRMQMRWDKSAKATTLGQLVFFAEFLEVAGVFDRWVEACPLDYSSGNASACRDVVGTWMLSVLDGHCRYAHIAGLRGDGVAPEILGMEKIISDEALRRALKAIAPAPDIADWLI